MKLQLFLFISAILTISSADWVKCSEKLCIPDPNNCLAMDTDFKCHKNGSIFKTNSTRPFQMTFTSQGTVNINGNCDENFRVEDVLRLWGMSTSMLSMKTLKIIIKVDSFDSKTDKTNGVFDFSSFPRQDSVTYLEITDRCVENVRGNVSQVFPDIRYLKILLNGLKRVPENVRMIPELRKIDLRRNEIEEVGSRDFEGVFKLQEVDLTGNRIRNLPDGFLVENSNIQALRLGWNQLTSVSESLLVGKMYIRKIELQYNQLETLPVNFLAGVKKVSSLALKGNRFRSFPPDFFRCDIDELYLYDNLLTEIPRAKRVKYIDLKGNKITHLVLPLSDIFPTAETVILSNNCIQNVTSLTNSVIKRNKKVKVECANCCLESIPVRLAMEVGELNISNNKITKFKLSELSEMYSKNDTVHLVLTNNRISMLETNFYKFIQQNPIFEFSDTNMIEMRGNPFLCDCHFTEILKSDLVKRFIEKISDLEFWRCHDADTGTDSYINDLTADGLVCHVLEHCPTQCKCTENMAAQYLRINCSRVGLTQFPTDFSTKNNQILLLNFDNNKIRYLPPRTWSMWNKIKELDLSHNKLESVANLTFSTELVKISLRSNNLTRLEPPIYDLFKGRHFRSVELARNPWKCSCDMTELRNLAVKTDTVFTDTHETACMATDGDMHDFFDIDEFCIKTDNSKPNYALNALWPCLAVIVIIISILFILFFRFKLEIKYFLFARGLCLRLVTEEDIDAAKLFDAFVSYSSEDGDWVRDVLVEGLENGHPAYKLCLHERDWMGGEFIPEQIVRSVQESRRTIIVLTQGFVGSAWSQIEFNVAYHKAFEDGVRRLIVVVPDEMPKLDKARQDLRAFLATTTYLEARKPHFWTKLKCSMPRVVRKAETIL